MLPFSQCLYHQNAARLTKKKQQTIDKQFHILWSYLVDQLSYSNYGTEKELFQQRKFLSTQQLCNTRKLNIQYLQSLSFSTRREDRFRSWHPRTIYAPLTIVDGEGQHWSRLEAVFLHQILALTPRGHIVQRKNLENSIQNFSSFLGWRILIF